MPKGLPEHREIVAVRPQPDNMLDTDSLGIAALKPVREAKRGAPALAPTAQKTLIPAAWCQLIPDEFCYAARVADRQPGWPVAARDALPPVSGHGRRYLTGCASAAGGQGRRPHKPTFVCSAPEGVARREPGPRAPVGCKRVLGCTNTLRRYTLGRKCLYDTQTPDAAVRRSGCRRPWVIDRNTHSAGPRRNRASHHRLKMTSAAKSMTAASSVSRGESDFTPNA